MRHGIVLNLNPFVVLQIIFLIINGHSKMNKGKFALILSFTTVILVGQALNLEKPTEKKGVKATTADGRKILVYSDGTWVIAPKEIFNIPVGDSYYIGPSNAKVTVMEWMDYQ